MEAFAPSSTNAVRAPTAHEYRQLRKLVRIFDWRDLATCERLAVALHHLGIEGSSLFFKWLQGSKHLAHLQRFWDSIDDDRSNWNDVVVMANKPGPDAVHVAGDRTKALLEETIGSAPRTTASSTQQSRILAANTVSILQPATGRRINFDRIDGLALRPAPLSWLIKNLLLKNSLNELVGQPGCGKSFLAVSGALCVAANRDWCGRKTTGGPVIYLAGEGNANIARRFVAAALKLGTSLDGLPLYVSSCAALLDQKPDVDSVIAAADEIAKQIGTDPCLIIIDTLARSMSGDESKTPDMNVFVRGMDVLRERHGAAVCVVHHSGLADGADKRGRGSSALTGAMDTIMVLTKSKDDVLTLEVTKMKDAEQPQPMGFRLEQVHLPAAWNDEDGQRSTSAVIVPSDVVAALPALTKDQQFALDVATRLAEDEGGRIGRKTLSKALTAEGVVDRKVRSRLVAELVKRGALMEDEKDWLTHPIVVSQHLYRSFDHKATLN